MSKKSTNGRKTAAALAAAAAAAVLIPSASAANIVRSKPVSTSPDVSNGNVPKSTNLKKEIVWMQKKNSLQQNYLCKFEDSKHMQII